LNEEEKLKIHREFIKRDIQMGRLLGNLVTILKVLGDKRSMIEITESILKVEEAGGLRSEEEKAHRLI